MEQHTANDSANGQSNQSSQANNNQEANKNEEQENQKIIPEDTDNDATRSGGSMSEGNLSNSRYGREKTGVTHEKTGITGSDSDGQAV